MLGQYNILVNESTQPIIPKRGLRQDDPLSPYIFILCENALLCTLIDIKTSGTLKEIELRKGGPTKLVICR